SSWLSLQCKMGKHENSHCVAPHDCKFNCHRYTIADVALHVNVYSIHTGTAVKAGPVDRALARVGVDNPLLRFITKQPLNEGDVSLPISQLISKLIPYRYTSNNCLQTR